MFEGMTVAMVTPFRRGAVDREAAARLVEHLIEGGAEGIVVSGSTGEAATTSSEERRALWILVRELTRRRVPLVAGTGTNSTAESVTLTRMAEELGMDGVMVVTPYYNKPTPAGQVAHFTAVAQATRLPVILYNVPGRTGTNTLPDTLAQLARVPNVVAVKEASGSVDQASAVRAACPQLTLLSGDDSLTLPMIAVGAAGVVSVAGNVAPRPMRELTDHAREGRTEEARRLHLRLLPLFKALFVESNPGPVKYLLSAMGLVEDELRLPLVPVAPATREIVRRAADGLGIALPAYTG
jgi:4-hydroxy-tetrahydrodipicolinate synthase